jgi:hypothetical protein
MTLRVAAGVGVESVAGAVYAAPLPDGPIMVLEGVAALIWSEAGGADRADVAAAVAETTGQDVSFIRAHVDEFIDQMIARGMLVED